MDRFEYTIVSWAADAAGADAVGFLNELGAEGWEAVGVAPRSTPVPMAGMGASVVPEMVIILKRRLEQKS